MRSQGGVCWRQRFLAVVRAEPNGSEWRDQHKVVCLEQGVLVGEQGAGRLEKWTVIWGGLCLRG